MNERIRELAEQASEIDGDDLLYYHPVFAEKFAELIVKETMQVVANQLPSNQYLDVAHAVIEHFGVEDRAVPILSTDEQALFAGITSSKLFTIEAAKKHFGVEE
jgi:carbamoylphosphate synthase large subunit